MFYFFGKSSFSIFPPSGDAGITVDTTLIKADTTLKTADEI